MTNLRNVISHCGGVTGNHTFLIDKFLNAAKTSDPDDPTDDERAPEKNSTKEAYMATAFLSGLNSGRYRILLNDLHNYFRVGHNDYPKTSTEAYELTISRKGYAKGPIVAPNDGLDFDTELKEVDVHYR